MLKGTLIKRLEKFLENRVPARDGGWPEVSREDIDELYKIFGAIADLKFERDCDGDQVIEFAISNRATHRLAYAHIPRSYRTGRDIQLVDILRNTKERFRAGSMLISMGNEALRVANYGLDVAIDIAPVEERLDEAVERIISSFGDDWKPVMKDIEAFQEKYDRGEWKRVIDPFMERYGDEPVFTKAIAEIQQAIDDANLQLAEQLTQNYQRLYGFAIGTAIRAFNQYKRSLRG